MAEKKSKHTDLVDFGIGEPEYLTPRNVIEAGKKALDNGYTKYTKNAGLPELREAMAEKVRRDNGIDATADDICVTVGGEQAIATLLVSLLNPGDEVLLTDPCFTAYFPTTALARGVIARVPLRASNGWHLDPKDLQAAITPKTKVILYNTPSNPCGAVASAEEMEAIAKVAIENNLFVISDEVYEKIIYDDKRHISMASLPDMADRTATVFSFSKTYSMTGWRIGYFVVKNADLKPQAFKTHQAMVACANAAAQKACVEALTGPQEWVAETVAKYDKSRELVHKGVNAIPGLSCHKPEGAFYAMVNVSELGPDREVANFLFEEYGVKMIPGSGFGPQGAGHLRLCYAMRPETIEKGLERIAAGAKELLSRK